MSWSFLCAVVSTVLSQWAFLLAVVVYFVWRKISPPYEFYTDRGIVYKSTMPLIGNMSRLFISKESIFDMIINDYKEFAGKRFYGTFDFNRPILAIRDPDLIRQITVKDFDYFVDHRSFLADPTQEPLFGKSLFLLTGQKWRNMRATLSPAFTGSKMRQMFQLVVGCSEQAITILVTEAKASSSKPFVPDMKDLFTRFTNDVIATSAFGIQVNSLQDRDNEFYAMGKRALNFGTPKGFLKFMLMNMAPKLCSKLGMRLFDQDCADFFHNLVHDTMRYREKEGILRPDMINLLMQARKGELSSAESQQVASANLKSDADDAGFATVEEVSADALKGEQKITWEDEELTAQCFLFFVAGFETSATALCFVAQELMENQDIQAKLIEELDDAKEQLNGKPLTYEALQKLTYLDMVISETLRKWPPAIAMDRVCQKPYQMTDENGHVITLQKGEAISVPAVAIHRDPQFYPDPDRFDPERFSEERKHEIQPFTYLPFGSGPRNCIGSRFALMELKAFLFYMLTTFTFKVAETSTVPLVLEPSFVLKPKNGWNVHLKLRS